LTARPEGALRHFFQDVVAADGFDQLFLGVFALVIVVVGFVARRGGDIAMMDQGFAVMGFGVRRVVVMRGIALMAVLVVAVVVLAVVVLVVGVVAIGVCGLDRRVRRTRGLNFRRQHSGRDRLMGLVGVIFMIVVLMIMMIGTLVRVLVMVMMRVMCAVMFGMRDGVTAFGVDAVMVVALGRMVVERVAVVFGMFLGMFVIVLLAFDPAGRHGPDRSRHVRRPRSGPVRRCCGGANCGGAAAAGWSGSRSPLRPRDGRVRRLRSAPDGRRPGSGNSRGEFR